MLGELRTAGRLNRTGFWLRHCSLVPLLLAMAVATEQAFGAPVDVLVALLLVLLLVSIWGRRLHDRARSAWWLLLVVIPVLGPVLLIVECGLRGTSADAPRRFGPTGRESHDYLSVRA